MTGSALFDFGITIIVLVAVVALFFVALDKLATDETLNKIAKIAVGVVALVIALLALKGVLFGGAGAAILNYAGLIPFAIGLIVLLVVMYIVMLAIDYFAGALGTWVQIAKFLVAAIAVIALLVLADKTLLQGKGAASLGKLSYHTQMIG